jgi:glutamate carboxypeptidase
MTSVEYFTRSLHDFLRELRLFVEIESPTGEVAQVERAAAFLQARLAPFGELSGRDLTGFGPLVRLRRPGTDSHVLLLAHYDTVWPVGSWPEPWRVDSGRAYGPGVYDMKCGLLFILWLLRHLDDDARSHPTLDIVLTPDEEVGSLASQSHVRQAAAAADFALVLEPTTLDGGLKVARKGSGNYFIEVEGRAAHQGAEPELGANAVVEAAHQILRLHSLEDSETDTTVGPNVVEGGTVPNTVPDRARVAVDVRAWTDAERQRVDRGIRGLVPVLDGTRLHITGRWNRPPMEASTASMELFARARDIAGGLGQSVEAVRWGGASDANFAAAAGAATIDGFGPAGEGAHQPTENIVIDSIPERLALLAELVVSLAQPPETWLSETALKQLREGRPYESVDSE